MSGKFGIFVAGGVVGAIAALLYAPRTGQETRALVADRANEAWGQARSYGSQAQARGQEIYQNMSAQGKVAYETASANVAQAYSNVSSKGQQAYNTAAAGAREALNNAKPVFADRNEDLREKIEAARARIAAQVAKNAEESQVMEAEANIAEAAEETAAEAATEDAEAADAEVAAAPDGADNETKAQETAE